MKRDAFWSALEAVSAAGLSVISSFLVARIIGPAELGVGAAATALNVVLWVATNALFADAVVQRADMDDRTLSSAFWASTGMGVAAMLVQAAAGPSLGSLMGDGRLVAMAWVLAVPLPLVGAAGTVQGLLTRERAYRRLALRTILGQGFGTIIGITAAVHGAGAWSLVLQQTVTSALGALTLLAAGRWYPRLCFDSRAITSLLKVGLPLTVSTMVLIARYRAFAVLIAASAGPAVLGQVHLAFRLVDTVRELTFTALWRLMLPALSACQRDRQAMLLQVDCWLRRCLAAILPVCAAMAICLTQAVAIVMGPDWRAAGEAALPLVGLMALSIAMFPASVALVAAGQARLTLYASLLGLITACAGAALLSPSDAWWAVAIWTVSQLLVYPYNIYVNARALRVGLLRPLSGGFSFGKSIAG